MRFFDRVIEIDLSTLEPHLVGPHTPDLDRPISQIAADAEATGYPREISAALVGSCTNSSYEDIGRAAHIARQATAKGMTVKAPLMITPGSEQVRATIERDGLLADLEAIGATVLANACGPCIGQWKREGGPDGPNTIVTSFNRNFPARNDGNEEHARVHRLAGDGRGHGAHRACSTVASSTSSRRRPPTTCRRVASIRGASGFVAPADGPAAVDVAVAPDSERLELLAAVPGVGRPRHPRAAGAAEGSREVHDRPDLARRPVAAVPRPPHEHLAEPVPRREPTPFDDAERPLPELAREFKAAGIEWIAVGDENYGEGSSREHAAMEPRFMGGRAVLARSFAADRTRRT